MIRASLILQITMTAQNEDFTAARPFDIIDCWTRTIAGAGGGDTTTLERQALGVGAFNAVSSTIVTANVANAVVRTVTLVDAQAHVVATDVIRAAGSAAATRAEVFVTILPDPI
jgi:hypothetical protein